MKKPILILALLTFILQSCSLDEIIEAIEQNNDDDPVVVECDPIPDPHAIIIKHGWDVPIISNAMSDADFIKEVEDSPYDGIILSVGDISDEVFSGTLLDQSKIDAAFSAMNPNSFSREMHNFVKLNVYGNTGDVQYEGEHLDNLVDNVKRFSRAAKAAGFKGIAFDNENYYDTNIWEWSEDDSNSICPGKTREECGSIVTTAGYKVIRAILEEWNTVKFMPFFGIWLRHEASWDVIQANSVHNRWYNPNKLEAEFLVGIYGGIHDRKGWDAECTAEFIDGGEIYSLSKREQFAAIAQQLRTGVPRDAPQFLGYLRQSYEDNVKIGFGIYDFKNGMFGIPPLTADEFVEMVRNGAQEADYIWLYPELYDFWDHDGNNWPEEKAPQEWVDKINCALQ